MQNSDFSPQRMHDLVQMWFDAANTNVSPDDRIKLYKNTEEVVTFLKDSGNTKEKIKELCETIIQDFEKHETDESIKFAEWIASNTNYQAGPKEGLKGAYKSLNDLFTVVNKLNEHPKFNCLDYIDYTSGKIIDEKQKKAILTLPGDVEQIIISELSIEDLLAKRGTSTHNKKFIDALIIDRLNKGDIAFQDLGIKNIDSCINFFGEDCKKIIRLNLHGLPTPSKQDVEKISESFPNIKYLSVADSYNALLEIDLSAPTLEINKSLYKDISFLKLCPHLTSLSLVGLGWLSGITDFSSLESLQNLKSINLSNCFNLEDKHFDFLKLLPNLEEVNLSGCKKIRQPDLFLSNCKNLKSLNLGWTAIQDFNFLKQFTKLENLNLSGCRINDISINDHSKLINLNLQGCIFIRDFTVFENSNLQILDLSNTNIENINFHLKNLIELNFAECRSLKDVSGLEYSSNLKILNLNGNSSIENINLQLKDLIELNLGGCQNLEDISGLECTNLKDLNLYGCSNLVNLNGLKHSPNIESLDLSECSKVDSSGISILENCSKLTSLLLDRCVLIDNIDFVKNCPYLAILSLMGCNKIDDISVLEFNQNLKCLNLVEIEITEINALAPCPHLKGLCISKIEDFGILKSCPDLTMLALTESVINQSLLDLPLKIEGLILVNCDIKDDPQTFEDRFRYFDLRQDYSGDKRDNKLRDTFSIMARSEGQLIRKIYL